MALNLLLSRWWLPLGHKAMITSCLDTPLKFSHKKLLEWLQWIASIPCYMSGFNLSIEGWEQRVGYWDPWFIDGKLCGKHCRTVPHLKCFLGLYMASGHYQCQSPDFLLVMMIGFCNKFNNCGTKSKHVTLDGGPWGTITLQTNGSNLFPFQTELIK